MHDATLLTLVLSQVTAMRSCNGASYFLAREDVVALLTIVRDLLRILIELVS